ncbi:hypothetical protein GQ44DRAFT_699505, partial [Phaeosphaeriaceae sp. PMI808]
MYQSMTAVRYRYSSHRYSPYGCSTLGYSFVKVFLQSHGTEDPESPHNDFVRWICRNRAFFVGTHSLAECAKQLRHPVLTYKFKAWNPRFAGQAALHCFRESMERMGKTNLRLLCLDDGTHFRMGWAVNAARLYDEVFMIPGCSRPIILRRNEQGQYRLIGDALINGIAPDQTWSSTRADQLQHIEI